MINDGLLSHIDFKENGHIDVGQLNDLYRAIGWDSDRRRTEHETTAMLCASRYYIAAHLSGSILVGFARVCGDPYVVQVLDVISHADYRRRGIATRCMQGVLAHIRDSNYVSVTLTSDDSMTAFYRRFGFRGCNETVLRWEPESDGHPG